MKLKKSELRQIVSEEIRLVLEKLEFDSKKLNKLISSDKFLKHMYKTKHGSDDPEAFFFTYVVGDDELEQKYMEI